MAIDDVKLNFDPSNVWIVNCILAFIMFGVALDLKVDDFKRVVTHPKGPAIGLVAQFLLFPAFTFLLTLILKPHPSVALGMILVAACPGGNMSNFITYLSGGNTALSVSMTAVSTFIAILMTPFNLSFWGGMNGDTAALLHKVNLSSFEVLTTVVMILAVPLTAGLMCASRFPRWADRMHKPFKVFSVAALLFLIAAAFGGNVHVFSAHIGLILAAVIPHNVVAFLVGYASARATGLPDADRRAVTIEVGIQNSALGLTLIFGFFSDLGGAAMVAGFWGVWHIVAGLSLAYLWSRVPLPALAEEAAS